MGIEYFDNLFRSFQATDLSQYTLTGLRIFAIGLFLVNVTKKYVEGAVNSSGIAWGITPTDLIKNFAVILAVIFSTQILGLFDSLLVAIESNFRSTSPEISVLPSQKIQIEQGAESSDSAQKGLSLLYEALSSPFFGFKFLSYIIGLFLWVLDLFIYPIFLAERFFLLGLMQTFFPLVISLSVFEKFRDLAFGFFKLYAAVFMIVPAYFLVNIFINKLYGGMHINFWTAIFGSNWGDKSYAPIIECATIGFIVLVKIMLYRKSRSHVLKLFGV